MDHVLTLVRPADKPFAPAEIAGLLDQLSQQQSAPATPIWLSPDIACDIILRQAFPKDRLLQNFDIPPHTDWCLQPLADRRKQLLLADMDSTIIEGETLDELAGLAGIKDQVASLTARAMRGEIDFAEALTQRVSMLKGLAATQLDEIVRTLRLTRGAFTLVATMRHHGAYCALVSGGFEEFTKQVLKMVPFNEMLSNHLQWRDGALTGKVEGDIVDKDRKQQHLALLREKLGITTNQTMAVGDGANDLPMIMAAGLGVAFRAKPAVAEVAPCRVDHTDLTALLYFQGYRDKDFVADPIVLQGLSHYL